MYILRSSLALKELNPLENTIVDAVEAKALLSVMKAQDPVSYVKVSERIDMMRKLYNDGLESLVEVGSLSREAADNMLQNREYLPVQYQELTDAELTGVRVGAKPTASPLRVREGGFKIELPDFEKMNRAQLVGFARKNKIEVRFDKMDDAEIIDLIKVRIIRREARVVDTALLAEIYFRKIGHDIQRQRAAQAFDAILTALPDNGIILRRAEMVRDSKGRRRFAELEQGATEEILPFRVNGELEGLVVDKRFADAFELRTQGSQGTKDVAALIAVLSQSRLRKKFFTDFLAPFFFLVAGPRDVLQLTVTQAPFRSPPFQGLIPGQPTLKVLNRMRKVAPDVFMDGPITQRYMQHGGAFQTTLSRTRMIEPGEFAGARLSMRRLTSKNVDSQLVTKLQNITTLSAKGLSKVIAGIRWPNQKIENLGRVTEFTQVEIEIAAEKGISVDDLPSTDIRIAAHAAIGRMDLSAQTVPTMFLEALNPYAVARTGALRSFARFSRDNPDELAARSFSMLLVGTVLYGINRAINEQALIDMPTHLKDTVVFTLPEGLGTYLDDENNKIHTAFVIPLEQNLLPFQLFGNYLGAMVWGDFDNIDVDDFQRVATELLGFRGTPASEIGLSARMFVEMWTNRSLVYEGAALFRGREGGLLGSEIDPEKTSPAMERFGRMFPHLVSPQRMQEVFESGYGNSIGAQLFGKAANILSFIPDLRPKDKKSFVQRIPGVSRIIKNIPEGGAGFRAQEPTRRELITADRNFRVEFARMLFRARARNDGILVEDDQQLRDDITSILDDSNREIALGMFERQILWQTLVKDSNFPRTWKNVLSAPEDVAGTRMFNFLSELTFENRLLLKAEIKAIVRGRVKKSKQWWETFTDDLNRFMPEFERMEARGDFGDLDALQIQFLRDKGRLPAKPLVVGAPTAQ